MSIREIDRNSSLDPGPVETIGRKAEEPGIEGDRETPAEQEVEAEGEGQDPADLPTSANAKKVFGMKRSNPTVKKGNDTYDYEQKYPEDAPYEEASSAARVWRTYEDESRNHDANMVEESRDNVDVLLVFAGLFSAVVTTFVAQTSQSLQPDYAAISASLLYESVLVQRAIANGSPVNSIAPSPLNPTIAFVPATTDVWVNGLWFTSLFLSLTTALVAVLVKQWLHHYVALPSGTPRERSFTRQFRYAGFEKWHVQVIIGLLPVLMHLALAIFLSGLVVFLHPLQAVLSWIICTGTAVVYAAYVLAAILPIIFPQCPYRTPLCDLVYISFCRIVPRVTWDKEKFLSSFKRGNFGAMICFLPRIKARNSQSLTVIESNFVGQMSINLAAEALHWLFSVTSNPTVQSIVIQSIGGLPMASEEKFLALQGDTGNIDELQDSLFKGCIYWPEGHSYEKPVPGMELKLGRLLRYYPRIDVHWSLFMTIPDIDSFELTVAILSNGCPLRGRKNIESLLPGTLLNDISYSTSGTRLPARCWYHLMISSKDVFNPLDPDNDDHANMFPLLLCNDILMYWSDPSSKSKRQAHNLEFDSSLLQFRDALLYFLDKIYDLVLPMLSKFATDPSLCEPSLPPSLRVFVAAIKFLLHRLSFPDYELSHFTIWRSLAATVGWIRDRTFSLQEATAIMTVLDDILDVVPPLDSASNWVGLWNDTILTYPSLTTIAPSACSLRGVRSMVDFMKIHWDEVYPWHNTACGVLADLLVMRIPIAFTAFLDGQCLQFLGNHTFHEASVPMVSAYIAGISAMQHGLDGAVDEVTHIDYLHNPQNLFTVCSILATHGFRNIDRIAIRRDITRLVQLRPRDAAWDECRRKLHDLVQGGNEDFFTEQCVWSETDRKVHLLQPCEIQVEEDNIRYGIHVLDNVFDGGGNTASMAPLDRFLGWCLGRRKSEDKPEQNQQV